jgi:hypothetical protein
MTEFIYIGSEKADAQKITEEGRFREFLNKY